MIVIVVKGGTVAAEAAAKAHGVEFKGIGFDLGSVTVGFCEEVQNESLHRWLMKTPQQPGNFPAGTLMHYGPVPRV